ncbi:hypothetical protein ABTD81_17800 [Acinetobacter baumannii]
MDLPQNNNKASFPEFYLVYAHQQGWDVPLFHLEVCEWLEDFGNLGVLMLPRGHREIYTS